MFKTFRESLCAGILIAIGGTVFLMNENKVVGAALFSVALLCICYKGYYLFTGKIGYLTEDYSKENLLRLFVGLLGNLLCTYLLGFILAKCLPDLSENAAEICASKLEQPWYSTIVRSTLCGVLMYLAVSIFKDSKTPLGIIFCIPVFILCGFEHSIADMFYFAASEIYRLKIILYMAEIILGNTLGAVILPLIAPKKTQ